MVSAAKLENKIVIPTIAVIWIASLITIIVAYLGNIDLGPIGIFLWLMVIIIPILYILANLGYL